MRGNFVNVDIGLGLRDLPDHDVIRISSFTSHWLKIHNP